MFKKIWTESWTRAWGYTKLAAGAILVTLHPMSTILTNTDVKAAIDKLNPPAYVGLALALIGAITLLSMEHKYDEDQSR